MTPKQDFERTLNALLLELPESVHKDATARIRAYVDSIIKERDDLKNAIVRLSQQLNDAATRHLNSEWEQDRGKGLLDAAFAVAALVKPIDPPQSESVRPPAAP